ncbi:hypothetical protein [Streptomyces triticiradicis]|uniref:Uncharacterized protein n=1 Tax=Streptomyces triticiradicis TaxID=2651189 RepID=A0A7J5DCP4_9ACTN|nr:hypothetical protein [Streptomyces triticiradicis]KAB1986332.1 hypothetical protein F8144_23375 [Streptomyces triticiradicis]
MSRLPRGVWATAGVLAVAAATVGVPSGRAVAAGAELEVASGYGGYTLKAMPYTDMDPNAVNYVTLANTGKTKITSYTLTVDYSSLGGFVDVTAPFSGCEKKTEGVLVCQGKDAPAPGRTTRLGGFRVRSLKGAKGGTTGEIKVSGQADGAAITERVWKVDIKDEGFVQDRTTGAVEGKVKPGAEVRPGAGFTYFGANTLKGTDFFMSASGTSFGQEFSNCDYGTMPVYEYTSGELTDVTYPAAICHFDDTIEVGDSFDVSPGPLRIDAAARGAHWEGRPGTEDPRVDREKMTGVHPGKGPELKLVPRPDSAPQGKPQATDLGVTYQVDNTADAEALGASAEGRPGDVVTVDVGYRNNGPGGMPTWTGSRPIEDPSVETTVTIPPGTTAVKVPKLCWTENGHESKPGARSYECTNEVTDWRVGPGERLVWSFGLRIDKASALKPGKVSLKVLRESDSNPKNDTAAITVKAPGAPGGTGGTGDSDGGTGSSGGTTGGSSGSGSGGGSDSGSGSAGGAHDTSSTSGQTGSMASTGAGTAPWIAGTAGVLAAGVGTVLFTTTRRRRRS